MATVRLPLSAVSTADSQQARRTTTRTSSMPGSSRLMSTSMRPPTRSTTKVPCLGPSCRSLTTVFTLQDGQFVVDFMSVLLSNFLTMFAATQSGGGSTRTTSTTTACTSATRLSLPTCGTSANMSPAMRCVFRCPPNCGLSVRRHVSGQCVMIKLKFPHWRSLHHSAHVTC